MLGQILISRPIGIWLTVFEEIDYRVSLSCSMPTFRHWFLEMVEELPSRLVKHVIDATNYAPNGRQVPCPEKIIDGYQW